MKLPGIDYGRGVESSAAAVAKPYEAAAKFTDVLAEGLTRYGQELVKTQQAKAEAQLSADLAGLEGEINSKRYVSTGYLRESLGEDFESLPGDIRSRLTRQQHDVVADRPYEADRDDIPMWEVASALYERKAKRLVEAAGKGITTGGWRAEFETRAAGAVAERRARLDQQQLRAMDADLRVSQQEIVEQFMRGGSFADAHAVLRSSQVFSPAEKEKLGRAVEVARVTKPIFDAIQGKDVVAMRELREGLARDGEYDVIDESRRTELANALDVRIKAVGLDGQARAEEERLWAQAKGDASKAITLARGIADTEVADEVMKRLKDRIATDHAAGVASDAPREARLEIGIYRSRTLSRTSDDYQALTDEGRARVEAKLESARRADQALDAEARRVQNEIDAYLLRFYGGSLPQKGKPGADQASINIDNSPLFAKASPKVREELKEKQRAVNEEIAKDGGYTRQFFLDKVTELGQRLEYEKEDLVNFRAAMLAEYDAELRATGVKGTIAPEKVNAILARAVPIGDAGGFHLTRNKPAWKARREGDEFSAFPEQPDEVRAALQDLEAIEGASGHDLSKPIIENPDGSFSTESTVTWEIDGKHVVMPTIVGGKRYEDKEALELYKQGKNPAVGIYDTPEAAAAGAQQRHLEEERLRKGDRLRRVKSIEEARALPKGTRFIDPEGIERVR